MNDNNLPKELRVSEWIKKANDDELTGASILRHRDAPPNGVCFVSQQMAEKCLKAFLVARKKSFPKIHPTDALWEMCHELDETFDEIKKECVDITGFYVETRYPGDYPEFTWKDAEDAFVAANKIKDFVMKILYV